ncbi:Uncharacterised protein [Candidatus Gugararchaeum adminiculabundum]|nr:Uncharacterised protein [Candidatus Gugararchaeum adminiculabundum]
MKQLLLDTNFLLLPGQFRVDLFGGIAKLMDEPFELIVPEGAIKELKIIASTAKAGKPAAKLALQFVADMEKKGQLKIVPIEREKGEKGAVKSVDDWIVAYTKYNPCIVCTNDKGLKNRLKENKVKTIILRERSYLGFG